MIIQTESGLSPADYASLRDATGDASLEVTLMQYSLSLTLHDVDGPSCLDTFDAIVCDDVVIRAGRTGANTLAIQTLATEDGGDEAWSAVASLTATGISDEIAISLATDGVDTVRVFYYDAGTGQIEYFESAGAKGVGNAASWGATALCMAVPDVVGIAATTLVRVHYLCAAGGYDNRHFRVAIENGGWVAFSSELYWQLPIDSFDAAVGPQADDGAAATNDILVIATDLPHIIGRKIDSGELIYTITQVQGIAVIRYQNGRWSDHYEFDVVDEAPSFPSRHDVRLSSSGDLLFMTYYREDGSETYSHTSIAISRSKDGIHWELPYLLTDVLGDANILLKRGGHAYLLNSWKCYRSPSVGYTGDPQNNQDITDYVVARTMASGDIKQLQLTLANPEQVLDALGVFDTDMSLQVRLKDGYWSGESGLLVQTMLGDVDVLGGDERLPTDRVILEARDLLSRMTAVRADQVNEWESQRVTGDNFDQVSSSKYSGMRHTAVMEGHWKTEGNELYIVPKEATCVATNTGIPDAYNGSCQTGFKVARTDSEDCAGLLFRCHDKRNYMNVRYVAEEDQIVLYRVQDNQETWTVKSAPLGWTYDTWYYLKIRFRYGYVWVYSSFDGATWIEQIAAPIHGVADGTTWDWAAFADYDIPNLSGKMGYIAHGYSDEDDIYIPPPPIITPPPGWGGVFADSGRRIIGTPQGVFVTDTISAAAPVWYAANDGLVTAFDRNVTSLARDPFHWWTSGGSERTLWAVSNTGVWKHEHFPDGTWVNFISIADIAAEIGGGPVGDPYIFLGQIGASIEADGLFAVNFKTYAWLGGGWPWPGWAGTNCGVMVFGTGGILNLLHINGYTSPGKVAFAQHSAGQVVYTGAMIAVCNVMNARTRWWKTSDQGGSWTAVLEKTAGYRVQAPPCAVVPYVGAGHDDRYVILGLGGWCAGNSPHMAFISETGGGLGTYTNLPGANTNCWATGAGYLLGQGSQADLFFQPGGDAGRVASPCRWTKNRGGAWTSLPITAAFFAVHGSFTTWVEGDLESALIGGHPTAGAPNTSRLWYWEQGDANWSDKTGNLMGLGVTDVKNIQRDSMGAA